MYNQSRKEKFSSDTTSNEYTRRSIYYVFNKTEPYESEAGKDIIEFTTEELQKVLNIVCGVRSTSIQRMLYTLKKYRIWCINNGVHGVQDSILHIDISEIGDMVVRSVKDPDMLQTYLDALFEDERFGTVSCVYRCYLWLAFTGVPEDAVFNVASFDVERYSKWVRCDGNKLAIPTQAKQVFKLCRNVETFNVVDDKGVIKRQIERCKGTQLLRVRTDMDQRKMRPVISRAVRKARESGRTDMELGYRRIYDSGLYFRAYMGDDISRKVSFQKEAARLGDSRKSIWYHENRLKTDYNKWKSVHYPDSKASD